MLVTGTGPVEIETLNRRYNATNMGLSTCHQWDDDPVLVPFVHRGGIESRRRRKPFPLEILLQEVEDVRRYFIKAWGLYCPSKGRFLERLGTIAQNLSKACNAVGLDTWGSGRTHSSSRLCRTLPLEIIRAKTSKQSSSSELGIPHVFSP